MRAFIEQDLGGEWQEEPSGTAAIEEPGASAQVRARVDTELAESARRELERFRGRRRGRILYALGLHAGGSVTLTVFDRDGAASAELSGPMVEQLREQLRSRDRGKVRKVLPEGKD